MTSLSDELELPAGSSRSVAEGRRGPDEDGGDQIETGARVPLIAPVMARAIMGIVFLLLVLVAFAYVALSGEGFWSISLSAVLLLTLVALQVFYFSRPGINLRSPLTFGLLAMLRSLFLPGWL